MVYPKLFGLILVVLALSQAVYAAPDAPNALINNINNVSNGSGTNNPVLAINFTANGTNNVTWNLSIYNSAWVLLQNWTATTNNSSAVETYAVAANGTYYANLTVIDNATTNATSFTVYVDQSAPVINSLSTSGVTSSGATLTANASDAYSGINNCTYSGAGTPGNLILSGGLYTASLGGLSASTAYTVNVTCYDNAGYSVSSTTGFTTLAAATSGGSGNGGGGGGGGATTTNALASACTIDIGNGKACTVNVRRDMSSSDTSSVLTTRIYNNGSEGCNLTDVVFTDTLPSDFASVGEISFTPLYSSISGATVTYRFPSFSSGESKSIAYAVPRWVPPSRAGSFDVCGQLSAKKELPPAQPVQPSANNTNASSNITVATQPPPGTTGAGTGTGVLATSEIAPQGLPSAAPFDDIFHLRGDWLYICPIALLILLLLLYLLLYRGRRKCPQCQTMNNMKLKACRKCGHRFGPANAKPAGKKK